MRIGLTRMCLAWLAACALPALVSAQDLGRACPVRSSYDWTFQPTRLLLRKAVDDTGPDEIVMASGTLRVDGQVVRLNSEDHDRVALFESSARALVPRVKTLAKRGVDLAASAVREQAGASSPASAADPRFQRQLDDAARDVKSRIDASRSTRDWHGPAFEDYATQLSADVLPLLAGGVAQQALNSALQGDLGSAQSLGQAASRLREDTERRINRKLQVLAPDVRALCPALHRLDTLESGVGAHLPGARRLDVIDFEG